MKHTGGDMSLHYQKRTTFSDLLAMHVDGTLVAGL